MWIGLKNIARVEYADITLNGITVVAGANGSGKSTISKSLYAALEVVHDPQRQVQLEKRRSRISMIRNLIYHSAGFKVNDILEIDEKVQQELRRADGNADVFLMNMQHFLDENPGVIILNSQIMFKELEQLFRYCVEIDQKEDSYYIQYFSQMILDNIFQKQINCLKGTKEALIEFRDTYSTVSMKMIDNKVVNTNFGMFRTSTPSPVYITTSDLVDFVGSYRTLYSSEKYGAISYVNSQLTKLLMREIHTRNLVAEQYHKLEGQKQIFENILGSVLEGEMYLEDRQLVYHDEWCNANIELRNIASGMKPFLILKRLISNGVFLEKICLIIDEPETNLHPEWQLKLAHLLVLLNMKLGVGVYLNSHSPYFVRAVEYYASQYDVLDQCKFYAMRRNEETGLYDSEDMTRQLGRIYDSLAQPFNQIM